MSLQMSSFFAFGSFVLIGFVVVSKKVGFRNVFHFFKYDLLKKEEANDPLEIDDIGYLVEERPSSSSKTSCLVDESSIYGRKVDKEAIIKFVLLDNANRKDLDVIPIVGASGVGKTTLAQLVFNDNRVKGSFVTTAWVSISKESNLSKITKDVLEEITLNSHDNKTLNQIQLELKRVLDGKKFLLVLDNFWNDDYIDWVDLRKPMRYGAKGSRIIVTTRNQRIASFVGTVPTYHLKGLSDDFCQKLFARHAFPDGNGWACPVLQVIGREIVEKCRGSPSLSKTLGSKLCFNRDASDWKRLLQSNAYAWDLWSLQVSVHSTQTTNINTWGLIEWTCIFATVILEVLVVVFDNLASPKNHIFGLVTVLVSFLVLIIFIFELISKGRKEQLVLIRKGMRIGFRYPSSKVNPYTFLDAFTLGSAISQFTFSRVRYSHLLESDGDGETNKVSVASLIYVICFGTSKIFKNNKKKKNYL